MQVANLELCKTLHELSGWDDTDKCWLNDCGGGGNKTLQFVGDWNTVNTPDWYQELAAAYDLGYLLRKLPPRLDHPTREGTVGTVGVYYDHQKNNWGASYGEEVVNFPYTQNADTPEDAACKLAIELFRQGILEIK